MPQAPGIPEEGEACPSRPRARKRGVVEAVLFVVGWLVVAVLGLVALLRLVAWDSLEPLVVLNALTVVVYLPAWVVTAGALMARCWWLGAAAAVIVAAQLVFVVPELSSSSSTARLGSACPGGAGV